MLDIVIGTRSVFKSKDETVEYTYWRLKLKSRSFKETRRQIWQLAPRRGPDRESLGKVRSYPNLENIDSIFINKDVTLAQSYGSFSYTLVRMASLQ